MVKAVAANTDQPWVVLYVKRWLTAPDAAARRQPATSGTGEPHRGQRSRPCWRTCSCTTRSTLWLEREFPTVKFERYADDAVVHCATERQARQVLAALAGRMVEVGLRLHPDKTKIVYCKDERRRGSYEHTSFTFLGYTFGPRTARWARTASRSCRFMPAVSPQALAKMGQEVRRWRLHLRTGLSWTSSPSGSTRSWRAG